MSFMTPCSISARTDQPSPQSRNQTTCHWDCWGPRRRYRGTRAGGRPFQASFRPNYMVYLSRRHHRLQFSAFPRLVSLQPPGLSLSLLSGRRFRRRFQPSAFLRLGSFEFLQLFRGHEVLAGHLVHLEPLVCPVEPHLGGFDLGENQNAIVGIVTLGTPEYETEIILPLVCPVEPHIRRLRPGEEPKRQRFLQGKPA